MSFKNFLYDVADGIATITINRPDKLNALNDETIAELGEVVARAKDDSGVRVIIVTGAGDKAFVAGADIGEISKKDVAGGKTMSEAGQRAFRNLELSGKPSIAAINGFALGGGCELAMACTIRMMADTAKMGLPEVSLGLIPGFAGTQRLPRIVGRGVALDLMLSGRPIKADEALRIGLVSHVVPADELIESARSLAGKIQRNSPNAIKTAIAAVDGGMDLSFDEACALEARLFGDLFDSDDKREGVSAFLEKRKPEFKGR